VRGKTRRRPARSELKVRAAELGGPSTLASQLKARQEMTDRLREKLASNPAGRPTAEAELTLLFHADPRLSPREGAVDPGQSQVQ